MVSVKHGMCCMCVNFFVCVFVLAQAIENIDKIYFGVDEDCPQYELEVRN